MKTHTQKITSFFVIAILLLSACSVHRANPTSASSKPSNLFAKVIAQAESAAVKKTQNNAQSDSHPTAEVARNAPGPMPQNQENTSNAWLGILGAQLTPEIAKAMNLNADQQGILIVLIESGSPADEAKLHASEQEVTIRGQTVIIGGDIITTVNGKAVISLYELRDLIRSYQPGVEVQLTILRDSKTLEVPVTLAERPAYVP